MSHSIFCLFPLNSLDGKIYNLSLVMRNPAFCICENKDADQLRGNREADQRLCFRYIDSTIPITPKYESFKPLAIFCDCTARFGFEGWIWVLIASVPDLYILFTFKGIFISLCHKLSVIKNHPKFETCSEWHNFMNCLTAIHFIGNHSKTSKITN